MSILDSFKAFDFSEGVPYVSITKNGLTFNKGVMKKLGYPQFVVLLMDKDTQRIAIQKCSSATDKSIAFYKGDKEDDANKILSVRWNSRDLMSTVKAMMNWDLSVDSYRAYGEMLEEENAMIFDLSQAEKTEKPE